MQVEREVLLPATPAEVWRALTDAGELERWLGVSVDGDLRPGRATTFREPGGRVQRAVVDEVEPGRRLRFRWWRDDGTGPLTEVSFELTEEPDGTRLRVAERSIVLPPVRRTFEGYIRRPEARAPQLALLRS